MYTKVVKFIDRFKEARGPRRGCSRAGILALEGRRKLSGNASWRVPLSG